ncbi:LacI family DNA-binding transcriptional regulator [Flexivirga sp. ID2601S]|uniref:LacI family DNA-binding transcriptional regulator n=1 Tax=Flexivirga aerilata TaxID=1656889 RepID=A0A849ACS1_9MICO|nr:LacI family DNA-binding transcriptional regulator [Flexivirga aerilata]NNG38269.1 LacI family DNA-binding transcriptional regulator [Flexivirga aerilata]
MNQDERKALGGPRTPKDRVTIYEVAQRAGVSIATVSHAMNRPEKVNAATRDRVLEAVDALGFTPKASAVSLARKGVGRIGVLAAFSAYPSYLTRLTGVMDACRDQAIDVVVYDEEPQQAGTSPWLSSLPATGRLDGLLVMGATIEGRTAERLLERGLPTVLVDAFHPSFTSVTMDDELGGYLLGQHLVGRGYQTFGFVTPAPPSRDFVSPGEHRLEGLTRAIREAGLPTSKSSWLITEDDFQGGLDAAADLLELDELPEVIVANHDALAAGVLGGLRARHVAVPDDVAIAGYDGLELARVVGLTTVRQPFAETGQIAAQLLLEQLSAKKARPVQHIKLSPELVPGDTA